jgi:integrase
LILTGARLREISELRWSEVDLDKATITLPPSRTKNHKEHIIPLNPLALEILKGRAREERELVFGSGGHGFSGFSKAKRLLDERAKLKVPFVVHDIRRLVATGLAKLVPPHIVECVLGHVGGFRAGVSGVYNQHAYEDEKRHALDLWVSTSAGSCHERLLSTRATPLLCGIQPRAKRSLRRNCFTE